MTDCFIFSAAKPPTKSWGRRAPITGISIPGSPPAPPTALTLTTTKEMSEEYFEVLNYIKDSLDLA